MTAEREEQARNALADAMPQFREAAAGVIRDNGQRSGLHMREVLIDADTAIRAMLDFAADGGGWIVGSGDGKRFRMWRDGMPDWTHNRDEATRYYRRADAEQVHREDEDAWSVVQFDT